MKQNADFDRIAQSWLQDGPTELPDRSLQAALDEVHVTSQQRFGAARRTFDMNANAPRFAVAAIIGLLVLIGGGIYLGNDGAGGVGAPTAIPSRSPSLSATPSAAPASPAMLKDAAYVACSPGGAADCLAPGTYRLTGDVWPGEITMEVPAGWFEWLPYTDNDAYDALLVGPDSSGWGLEFNVIDAVAQDPCVAAKGNYDPAETGTVDGLVAAMSRWPGFEATAPVSTEVGGYSGQLIELTSTRTSTDCPSGGSLWTIPQGGTVNAYPMVGAPGSGRAGTFRIVDVNGTLLVIRTTDFPGTAPNELVNGIPDDPTRHAAHQVVMRQILDSIQITGAPAQP